MFDIYFLDSDPSARRRKKVLRGRIVLGDYSEEFDTYLDVWNRDLFELHWLGAARRLVDDRESSTAFFTTTFQSFWSMWRRGDAVLVNERLLVKDTLIAPFDPAHLYRQVGRYRRYSDGQPISQWVLKLSDLRRFINRRGKKHHAG